MNTVCPSGVKATLCFAVFIPHPPVWAGQVRLSKAGEIRRQDCKFTETVFQ